VTDEFNPSLYSVKGKRIPVIRHLPQISWSVMNQGDVYVLDNKKYIFVWIGRDANNHEKMFAAKVSHVIFLSAQTLIICLSLLAGSKSEE
jgi:Gelsolin repeat